MPAVPAVASRPPIRRAIEFGRSVMARVDPRPTFFVAFAIIVAFGILGGLDYNDVPLGHMFFLDGEGNAPAAFSGLLLIAAGVACWYVAADVAPETRLRWRVLGAFFAFMAFDEALTIHERLSLLTDVAWQKLYLPVFVIAFFMALACLASLRDVVPGAALLVGGGACWFVAQVLEKLEANKHDGQVEHYWVYATFEECLEMTGSLLFLLAAVAVYQTRRSRVVSNSVVSQGDLLGHAHAPRVDDQFAHLDSVEG